MNITKPIRVLHVLPSLAVRGGMVNVVENYRKHLNPNEVHFDYVYLYDLPDNCIEEAEQAGTRTFYLPIQNRSSILKAIESFFCDHDGEFDILHCHPPYTPQIFGRAAKRHGVRRIIAHSHSTKYSDNRLNAVRNWSLAKFLGFFATDYIACSEDARVLLGSHGGKALILHNAIDCEKFLFSAEDREVVRNELGISEGVFLLGSIGRLSPEKNQGFMIDILYELKNRGVDCKLAIAGSGKCEESLIDKSNKLGLNHDFLLLGNRTDTPRLYSAFDAFLLTSTFEGVPLTAIEAQSCGAPCFLSDVISHEVGIVNVEFLPVSKHANVWADEILSSRPKGVDVLKANSAIINSPFNINTAADSLLSFYRRILDSK